MLRIGVTYLRQINWLKRCIGNRSNLAGNDMRVILANYLLHYPNRF